MTHRKHYRKPQGELVATTANPKEKPEKCKEAYENRSITKEKEYANVPIAFTIENNVTPETLKKLKKLRGVKYYVTLLSIKKECTPFEASEYLKGGIKIEIIKE